MSQLIMICILALALGWPSTASVFPSNLTNIKKVNGDSRKLVCVCNEEHCDEIQFEWPTEKGEANLVQSSQSGLRFHQTRLAEAQNKLSSMPQDAKSIQIDVDLNREHQTILGWGGAFTDAAALNIANLSSGLADRLIESYYGDSGLQYNFGRVPIAGTDFSTRPYSYDDTGEPDYGLESWSLTVEDTDFKIPLIKKALELAQKSQQVSLKLFASPWSPPKWMKTNKNLVRGFLIDDDRIYKSYAEYLLKFYEAYEKQGIKFWGATVQNEPIVSYLPNYFFNSLQFGNNQMSKFISEYLGPALEARNMTKSNFKLMVGDDSLGFINYQVSKLLANPEVEKYISGVAFHWYASGLVVPYKALDHLYESVKDKVEFMIMSEACAGSEPWVTKKVDLGSWERGESYGNDIMEDISRQASAWIDWNLALDTQGGPNWSGNFVDSPIIVDASKNEFYKQPMYYFLAHFSRFFKPGSVRVGTEVSNKRFGWPSGVMAVSVHNKQSGHLIINILNKSAKSRNVELRIGGLMEKIDINNNAVGSPMPFRPFMVEGKSINSIVIKL